MDAATIGSIVGLLVSVFGALRWLMNVNEKKNVRIIELEKENNLNIVKRLEDSLEDFAKEMAATRKEITSIKASLALVMREVKSGSEQAKAVFTQLKEYADRAEKRFAKLESDVVKVGQDLIMIRGKKSEA